MTQQLKTFLCLAAFAAVGVNLHAQTDIAVTITIAGSVQSSNQTDTGGVTSTPAPTKFAINTASLLTLMAIVENLEGNYPAGTKFPTGAKLVNVFTPGSASNYQVVDKNNVLLVDVNDLLTDSASGVYGATIMSGKQSDTTTLADPTLSETTVWTLHFDDSTVLGIPDADKLQFSLTGVNTISITDAVPSKTTGAFKETDTMKVVSGMGDGITNTSPMTMTGTVSMTGSTTITP